MTNTNDIPTTSAPVDTGLTCLVMMARLHGVAADGAQLAHEYQAGGQFSQADILLAAKKLGLKAKVVRAAPERLARTPLPAVAIGVDGRFFIIARVDGEQALIHDPAVGRPTAMTLPDFAARWSGELILFTSRASLAGEMSRFDLGVDLLGPLCILLKSAR